MTKQVQLRRGTSSEHAVFTGAVGEVTVDTTLDVLVVHDGVTLGGHYLVGTGYGATVTQGMVNKTFVGIGTTTTNGAALVAVGDAAIKGRLTTRSLEVLYEPPIEREGTLTDTQIGDPNELLYITGIATNNIRVGYPIQNFNHIDLDCVVAGIGVSTIELSIIHFGVVGTLTTTFSFINPFSGATNLYDLEVSNDAIIAEAGITTAYVQDLFVNAGIVTTAGITSAYINDAYINSGIVTTLTVQTSYLTNANISAGIITSANIENAYVNNLYGNIGLVTTITGTDLTYTNADIDNLYVNVGVITAAGIETGRVVNFYATTGIVTTAGIESGRVVNLYANSGIVTSLSASTGYINDFYYSVGIGTTLASTNLFANSAFITSGIITTAYINTGIITTTGISSARVNDFYANSGVVTTLTAQTSYLDTAYTNIGFSTIIYANQFYLNSGIITSVGITTANITTSYVDQQYVSSGFATSFDIVTAYVNSGIVTFLNVSGVSTLVGSVSVASTLTSPGIAASNIYANIGFATDLVVSDLTTTETLQANSGLVTSLTGTYLNYSGVSTFGSATGVGTVTIGIGTTALFVDGSARITGILTIGSGSITIDGRQSSIDGIQRLVATAATITNLVGENVKYTGISTFSQVGIGATLSLVGFNTVGNQDKTVKIQLSNSGIASDYTLVLPAKLGSAGQLLGITPDGILGFTTNGAGLFESRYYVSARNGDDAYDGKALPVKTIKRAAQLASFDSFQIPGQRYLDAGDLLESNKEFIKEESVAYVQFNYENIGVATIFPDFNAATWKSGISSVVDALAYDIRFGGNSKSINVASILRNSGTYTGEEVPLTFAIDYVKFLGQYVINNQSPPTLYQTAVSQTFDFTIIDDPENNNANYFHRSKDARNLIVGNRQEIIDKSLASVAVGVGSTFFFPGEVETNPRSRYYDSYKLITINKQEIVDKSMASLAIGFPTGFYVPGPGIGSTTKDSRYYDSYRLIQINKAEIVATAMTAINVQYPTLWSSGVSSAKCQRDLGYFVDAVSTDVFTGGNNYARAFTGFYFVGVGTTSLAGEEQQTIYGFQQAGIQMRNAITNRLTNKNLGISSGPTSYTGTKVGAVGVTSTAACTDVQNTITSLVGVVTAAVGAGNTNGLPALNLGNFNLSVIGFGTTAGIWKCARDTGFFVDAVSTDVFTGGNNYTRSFAGFYFNNVGSPIPNGLVGETEQSNYVFTSAKDLMSSAVTNQLNSRDLTITADAATGFNTSPNSCANVRSTIASLTGIVTTVVAAGSTAGIGTTTNYGYFLVTPTYNVRNLTGISTLGIGVSSVGIGTTTVVGGRKCARDLGYIVDAIAQDVSYGTNQHIIYATKKYFNGAGTLVTNGVLGEETASVYAFRSLGTYAKQAVTNWLNYQDLTIQNDVSIGSTNKNPNVCANTRSTIDSLVGILTTALLSGSLVGIASTSIGGTDCADVRSAIVNYTGIVTTIIGFGTEAGPALSLPQTKSNPVCIIVEAGDYTEDNPIILYDDVAIVGDNLRNTIVRPLNAGKDLFRVRNGVYVTGFAMKDAVDAAGIPQSTFDYAVAFDDPTDPLTSRAGYATKTDKPIISRSPYIQNCSILSFLGGNGILVDGSKVLSPNIPLIAQEAEIPVLDEQPEQGKSMVAATFTMVSFGGIGWRTINDGYAQVVSCFQIFCRYGSLTQSGGYLSITNSATNFGFYALRSTGFSPNSFRFDRGRIAATGTSGGLTTLKIVGLGRSEQDLYVLRFFDNAGNDQTANFKPTPVVEEFIGTAVTAGGAVNTSSDTINIALHPFQNGDSLVYLGDEGVIPSRIIGGLVNQNQYYVKYVDSGSFQLAEDDSLTRIVDLTSSSTGIHTLQKNTQEFFAKEVIDRHNIYQRLTIAGIQTLNFVSGRAVQQTVSGGTAVGYAYTWNNTTRQLVVSVELSEGVRRNFAATGGSNLTISDHSGSPISTSIVSVAGLSTYWSLQFKVDSTLAGGSIQGVPSLPETYKLHFHRPSIINSSSHTWEFSGSGIDYNALPQNGGKTDTRSEQIGERGGRVFSSGTNELGDFKIGDFITAFNRTGNIIFNNTVTIGVLDSLRLSLSGGVAVEEFSTDGDLGDNETGGPLNKRVSTQLAVRSFLNNRLGNFIDKLVSTNAIPNAIVQLNSIGQINADLIPPKTVNYYRASNVGGRTQLVNLIPATNLSSGDVVSEPIDSFVLVSDLIGQYLILNNSSIYNFQNGDQVVSTTSAGGAIGIVTTPPTIGVNTTTLSFPNVGYGTTGLVRGVALTLKSLSGGSGYSAAGIYTGLRLDTSSGIGTGLTATITVSAAGTVSNVAINTGGFKFATNDILTLNDPTPVGGRSGGSNFTVQVNTVETRLYLKLTNQQKFPGSSALPDYIADRNATGVSTNIGIGTTFSFTPTDIGVGGSVDFANDRIVVGAGHTLQDGDPVVYTVTAGTVVSPLENEGVYYIKRVGLTSVALYTTYALSTIKDLESSGTGSHSLTRPGIVTSTDQIVFKNHGFVSGDPVRVTGNTPTGVTTGNFYFTGSVTQNSFTLHETRAESLTSVNGLLLNAIDLSEATNPVGIMTFTKQNITYSASVNTSSNDENNFSLLSTNSLDAANIVSGTISPTRLGSGSANNQTFLRGDSSYQKVVTAIGIGSTQPFDVQGYTSADFPAGGVGFTTYYGIVKLGLNRVQSTIDAYSTLGIAKFKTSTFSIGADGAIEIRNSAGGGDVDASTLGGNSSAYHLDVTNHTGTIPITRGGTGLTGAPSNGAILIGNGTAYTLTTTPTLQGLLTTQSILVSANQEIYFTSGTYGAERAGKIQFASNSLYLQFTTSLIGRNASGTNVFTLGNTGNASFSGTLASTTLTLNGNGSTTAAQLTINGATNNWINFGTNGVAAPAFTTRSLGTKVVYYTGLGASSADYAAGIEGSTLWHSVPTTSQQFNWYGGTTVAATLTGVGNFSATGTVTGTQLISNIATGTAPLSVTSTTTVTNLRANYVTFGMFDNNDDFMNFRVMRNNNTVSNRDGMYIGYGNANSGDTKLYGGGNTSTPVTIGNGGTLTASSTVTGTRLISNIATGTAPLSVTSTTECTNLNAALLNGFASATGNTLNAIVRRDGSGNFTAGTITATAHTVTGNLSAWNTTTPGTGLGGVHLGAASGTTNVGPAITFGARDASSGGNAQAGIYINSDGAYGTRMYFATTDSYASGSKVAMLINEVGAVSITRSNLVVAGTVTANSDIRLKTNIETISDALNKVLNLRGVIYDRIDSGERQIGVIAQEVESVVPELVHENDGTKSVAYSNMVAVLIEAIKEQQVQINELRDEIKKLKSE
jgi:hypothetical protein